MAEIGEGGSLSPAGRSNDPVYLPFQSTCVQTEFRFNIRSSPVHQAFSIIRALEPSVICSPWNDALVHAAHRAPVREHSRPRTLCPPTFSADLSTHFNPFYRPFRPPRSFISRIVVRVSYNWPLLMMRATRFQVDGATWRA